MQIFANHLGAGIVAQEPDSATGSDVDNMRLGGLTQMTHHEVAMTGDDFVLWLELMKEYHGANKGECARLLGRKAPWISVCQTRGADMVTALACAALLAGLEPFAGTRAKKFRAERVARSHPVSGDQAHP